MTLPHIPQETAVIVAVIALVGTLLNILATYLISRKRVTFEAAQNKIKQEQDELLMRLKSELDERLKAVEFQRTRSTAEDDRKRNADSEKLKEISQILPPSQIISFLHHHDFGGTFDREELTPLSRFLDWSPNPMNHFLNADLEMLKVDLTGKIQRFNNLVGVLTFPRQGTFSSVLPESEVNSVRSKTIDENAKRLNDAAETIAEAYEKLLTESRAKLGS